LSGKGAPAGIHPQQLRATVLWELANWTGIDTGRHRRHHLEQQFPAWTAERRYRPNVGA
jgi:hypothetical protein